MKQVYHWIPAIVTIVYWVGCAGGISKIAQKERTLTSPDQKQIMVNPPGWVLSRGHDLYPSSRYLLGVGVSGVSAVSANDSARAELAKNLRVKIQSTIKDISTDQDVRIISHMVSQVETVLEGVEIKDGWYDSNIYYSLAVLNRSIAAERIRHRFQGLIDLVKGKIKQGDESVRLGLWHTGLIHYISGYEEAILIPALVRAYSIISSGRILDIDGINTPQLLVSRIQNMAHDLRIEVVSGDQQVTNSLKGLNEPLIARVFKNSDGKPLSGIPVIFYFEEGDGRLIRDNFTGSDGTVETTIQNILASKIRTHRVVARIQYENLITGLESQVISPWLTPLINKRVLFRYIIKIHEGGTEKSLAWKKGIANLVDRVIEGFSPKGHPLVGVMTFKDLRLNEPTLFSRILKEDFQSFLVQQKKLILREPSRNFSNMNPLEWARQEGLKYFITGSYRLEKRGLEVRVKMTESKTGHVISAARVQIDRNEVHPDDLFSLENSVSSRTVSIRAKRIATKPESLEKSKLFFLSKKKFLKGSFKNMHEDKFLHSIKIDNKSTLNIPLSSIERNFSETIKNEKNSLSKNISDDYKQQNKMNEGEDYSSDQDYRKLNNHVNIELLGKERNPKQDIQKEGVPFGRWVRYRDEVALDKRTNLMWMVRDYRNLKGRAPNDYKEIAGWADEINRKRYGGFNNWRIPSIEEYEAIFDSSRMRLGFAFNIETPSVNQVMRAKPVGYPKIFENGGGYWYWSNERDSRCAQLLKLPNLCFRVFNFRDGITGSRSPLGGDSMASSIRLVRGVH